MPDKSALALEEIFRRADVNDDVPGKPGLQGPRSTVVRPYLRLIPLWGTRPLPAAVSRSRSLTKRDLTRRTGLLDISRQYALLFIFGIGPPEKMRLDVVGDFLAQRGAFEGGIPPV